MTCTVAVRRRPAAVVKVSGPEPAPSGTVMRTARSLQPPAPITAAGTVPPPAPASATPPVPCVPPNPKPSITAEPPRSRMGSIAPST